MRLRSAILAVLLRCLCVTGAWGYSVGFGQVSIDDGLSCNVVHDLCRDSRGFLWAATSYGLCRYDGARVQSWFKDELDLASDFITCLTPSASGDLWIGSDAGVSVYDVHMDRFVSLASLTGVEITDRVPVIQEDAGGDMWIAVNHQGLMRVTPGTWEVRWYFRDADGAGLPAIISSMLIDTGANRCFLGVYQDNLYVCDTTLSALTPMRTPDGREPFRGANVRSIIKNRSNSYLVSHTTGVSEVNPATGGVRPLHLPDNDNTICKSLHMVDNHTLWVATNSGIISYDLIRQSSERFNYSPSDHLSLPDSDVLCITGDVQRGIAVGTYGGGIGVCASLNPAFTRVYKSDVGDLYGKRVRDFAQAPDGRIWVGTELDGLYEYDMAAGALRKSRLRGIPDDITSLLLDGDLLWITSRQGLLNVNTRTGRVRRYPGHDVDIYKLFRDSRDTILVGTTLGVLKYDGGTDSFEEIPSFRGLFVDDIAEDADGNIWLATFADGLIKSSPSYEILRNLRHDPSDSCSLPGNKVMCVLPDTRGYVWAGPHGCGLCKIGPSGRPWVLDHSLGLSNNIVYKILEDYSGRLWVATDMGLTLIEPDGGRIRRYNVSDGLMNNDFNYSAGIRTESGELLFGSRDGFVRFDPDRLASATRDVSVILTGLWVNGVKMLPGGDGSPLSVSISDTRSLSLRPGQNSLTFDVSALREDLTGRPDAVLYRLDSYNSGWQPVGSDMQISFVNLPAGHYMLYVADNDPVEIIIHPEWYATVVARVLYALLALGCIFVAVWWQLRRSRIREEGKRISYERDREKELYKEKISFLSGVAHEIKTPLTLIKTPLDNILSHADVAEDVRSDLRLIGQNARDLTKMIEELLDFSRVEQQGFRLTCEKVDLVERVRAVLLNFRPLMDEKHIECSFDCPEESIIIDADPMGVTKIINNLMSNAVKYASSLVEVTLTRRDGSALLRVRNDGEVVPPAERERIFNAFVQYHDSKDVYYSGFGIGLSLARTFAQLHGGTLVMDDDMELNSFTLTLPCEDAAMVEAEAPAAPEDVHEVHPEGGAQQLCVLLVEDQSQLLKFMADKLSGRYTVRTATDGRQAVEMLSTDPPHKCHRDRYHDA